MELRSFMLVPWKVRRFRDNIGVKQELTKATGLFGFHGK